MTDRRHRAARTIAERARRLAVDRSEQVFRQRVRFRDGELRRRRRGRAVARVVHERTIADRPQAGMILHAEIVVDDDAAALDRQQRALDERVRARADRAQHGCGSQEFTAGKHDALLADGGRARTNADTDSARHQRLERGVSELVGELRQQARQILQ